jgi:RNA polymerase sigma-70 factor (ECF subfamily)
VDQLAIEAARQGDRTAQAALLRYLQDPWFRVCLSLLGSTDDAREAVQETALRFLRDLPRFRGQSSLMTWSMGIAVNVTREMRRRRMQPSIRIEADGPLPPDEASARIESRELLRAALADLPQRQREALVLRYFEDLTLEQTADAMDCALGTVKATVHQALRALEAKLKHKLSH